MRPKETVILAGIGLLLSAAPAPGHHAFAAEFDASRPVTLKGKIIKLEWINPHAWIHVSVVKPDGTTEDWMIEGGTPNTLFRRGITKNSLQIGTEIIVDGYQAKNLSRRANGRDVTFPDGRKLFLGSSGTGAPSDGRDPTEKPRKPPGKTILDFRFVILDLVRGCRCAITTNLDRRPSNHKSQITNQE